jgi:hypothetical protein
MKTKMQDHQKRIVDYLIEVKQSDPETICFTKKIPLIIIYTAIKALEAAGAISVTMKDGKRILTMVDAEKAVAVYQSPPVVKDVAPVTKKTKQEVSPVIQQPDLPEKTGKRDTTKYTFQNEVLSKGRLVLALIRRYVKENSVTLEQLHAAWPDAEIKPFTYGLIKEASVAKKINTDSKRTRFFVEDADLIKTNDGVYVSVSNQMTSDILVRVLEVAKRHGYTVKSVA